jgi:hypothetical protein
MAYHTAGDQGASGLALAMANHHTLTSLDLAENQIGAPGAMAVLEALRENPSLTVLDVGVGPRTATSLALCMGR